MSSGSDDIVLGDSDSNLLQKTTVTAANLDIPKTENSYKKNHNDELIMVKKRSRIVIQDKKKERK